MSFTGPSECVDSHFGQQTGRDGFHDGKGDLWVSYTQHHYQAPVAYSGVLRSHWRRVSLTLIKLFFYFTECECIRRHHIWVSNPETAFLSLPLSLFQSTCQSWLDEVPDYCQLSSSSKSSSLKEQDDLKCLFEPGYFQCFVEQSNSHRSTSATVPSSSVEILREGALRSICWCGGLTCWIIGTVNPQWSEGSEEADQFLLD